MTPSRASAWLNNSWSGEHKDAVDAAFKRLSHEPDFALVVEDLARYAGLRTTSFVPGQADQMAFCEGQRDLVFHLLEMAGMDLTIQPARLQSTTHTETTTKE